MTSMHGADNKAYHNESEASDKRQTMLNIPDQRLAIQAYEKILKMIMSRQIQPGDLLNERRLAEMLDMSRTPVRDALLILEGEGLLLRQGRRGLQVKRIQVDDFLDALQVRLLLEPAVARMAAGKVAGDILDALEGDLKAGDEQCRTDWNRCRSRTDPQDRRTPARCHHQCRRQSKAVVHPS